MAKHRHPDETDRTMDGPRSGWPLGKHGTSTVNAERHAVEDRTAGETLRGLMPDDTGK